MHTSAVDIVNWLGAVDSVYKKAACVQNRNPRENDSRERFARLLLWAVEDRMMGVETAVHRLARLEGGIK